MTEQRARRDSRRRHELAVLVDAEAREQATQRGTLRLVRAMARARTRARAEAKVRVSVTDEGCALRACA